MGPRRQIKKTFSCDCSISLLLLITARILTILSVIGIGFAYVIQKLGYVHFNEDVDELETTEAASDSWFYGLWPYSSHNPHLRHQYPLIYASCKQLDYFWRKIFICFDCIFITLYNFGTGVFRKCVNFIDRVLSFEYYENYVNLSTNFSTSIFYAAVLVVTLILFVAGVCHFLRKFRSNSSKKNLQKTPPEQHEQFVQELRRKPIHYNDRTNETSYTNLTSKLWHGAVILTVVCCLISIPWEFIRIYQMEVAKKAAITLQGSPAECLPDSMTFWQSLKSLTRWSLSFSPDSCQKYHQAVLVDPLWEVTPLMVLSSLITRCVTTPFQTTAAAIGASVQALLQEIPLLWQPVFIATIVVAALFCILAMCRYRLILPLFLRFEPKTPIIRRTCRNSECVKAVKQKYKKPKILSIKGSQEDKDSNGKTGYNHAYSSDSSQNSADQSF